MAFRRPMRRVGAPLLRTAAVGGVGYMAGRSAAQSAQREQAQDEQIAQMQQAQYSAPPAPAPAAPSGGDDIVAQLKRLAELKDAGALTQQEFDAAKQKVLAGG